MQDCPHIYFAGNQPEFGSRIIQGPADQQVLLISVPKFSLTKTIVLVDLETMSVEQVEFNIAQTAIQSASQ